MMEPRQETIAAYQDALRKAAAAAESRDLRLSFRSNMRVMNITPLSSVTDCPALQCSGTTSSAYASAR